MTYTYGRLLRMVRISNTTRYDTVKAGILPGQAEREHNVTRSGSVKRRQARESVNAFTFNCSKHSSIPLLRHNWRIFGTQQDSSVKGSCLKTKKVLTILGALIFSAAVSAETVTHHYTVTVDYSMSWLWVEARFSRPVDTVTARSRSAGRYLEDVRGCNEDPKIRMRNRRMMLPEDGIRCLNYTVNLERAASEYRNSRNLAAQNIVVSPSYWLWRPELFDETNVEVEFQLPENVRVSVPWEQLDGSGTRYRLGRSPESASAPAVFGDFDYREIEVPGAVLRVALLQTREPMNNDAIMEFVQATATDVSLAYGYFPNPSPQVLVVPISSSRSSSPVPFGRVIRDGGETVELFINPAQPQEDFLKDWTATHEFSHMMVPYLHSEYRWISEGLAQYYQNVLLTRAGAYEEQEAWQKIYAGLERGRQSRPELSPNAAASGSVRSARMKVYWSGAALALMADVNLREQSGGEESLDTVLRDFQACCLPSRVAWTGPEFFQKLDSLASKPVFMPLYRRYADTAGFPDTSEYLRRLGVRVKDDDVSLRRRAELVEIRQAITQTDMPTAYWRGQLATN